MVDHPDAMGGPGKPVRCRGAWRLVRIARYWLVERGPWVGVKPFYTFDEEFEIRRRLIEWAVAHGYRGEWDGKPFRQWFNCRTGANLTNASYMRFMVAAIHVVAMRGGRI